MSSGAEKHSRRESCGYQLCRADGFSGLLREGWEFSSAPEMFLERLDDPASHICKDRPKVKAVLADGYFLKRYNTLGFFNALRRAFRPPRPMRVLKAARRLQEIGLPTPEVFAALRKKRFGVPQCDYLVTAELPAGSRSGMLFTDHCDFLPGAVEMMVRMHSAGIEHGDLNVRNLFCTKEGEWGVIDLDGAVLYQHAVPFKRRRRELARLVSSILRRIPEQHPLDRAVILDIFAEKYQELSGIDLRGKALEARTHYLTERIRKDYRK